MSITIIAAVAENNVIGANNSLPWNIPEDLRHFKNLTRGKVCIMGKNTFESLPGILPNRINVVIAKEKNFTAPDPVIVFHDLNEALDYYKDDEVWIMGGGSIYSQTVDKADALEITHINRQVQGDTVFPDINQDEWKIVRQEKHDEFEFVRYERI